jgi:hypothetical protein
MGKLYNGGKLHYEWLRIDFYELLRYKYFLKDSLKSGIITWNNGNSVAYTCDLKSNNRYLKLNYSIRDSGTPYKKIDYVIKICSMPSNLGKGDLLYFICPITNKKCRILYLAYDSLKFFSRYAYSKPIYYPSQLDGKKMKELTMYYHLRDQICEIESQKNFHSHYLGEPTKAFKRLVRLKERKDLAAFKAKRHLRRHLYLLADLN